MRREELVRHYVSNVERYWPEPRQSQKLRSRIHDMGLSEAGAIERVLAITREREGRARPPVYIAGCPGSGSTWLNRMISDLPGFASATEVYFPAALRERLARLPTADRAFVVDCVHVLHALRRSPTLSNEAIVNSASDRLVDEKKAWNPDSFVIHLHRDPRDQVLSMATRKEKYRRERAPAASDREYLLLHCRHNVDAYRVFRALRGFVDYECRYETLVSDARTELRRILDRMGVAVGDASLEAVVRAHDRNAMRAGAIARVGNADEGGISQGWERDASPETQALLGRRLAESIVGLGYETRGIGAAGWARVALAWPLPFVYRALPGPLRRIARRAMDVLRG